MLGLLMSVRSTAVDGCFALLFLASAALFLVNPAMVVVVPGALLVLWLTGRVAERMAAVAGYGPLALLAGIAWLATGDFIPTLSTNGALNIWLGNNPNPRSRRGVGEGTEHAGTLRGVATFLADDPAGFARNLARKAALYWAPWDDLRSGKGGRLQPLVFAYVALAQGLSYGTLWRMRRHARSDAMLLAVLLALFAWLLYTAFFVKIRFRVPFDLLLFLACMIPVARELGAPPKVTPPEGR